MEPPSAPLHKGRRELWIGVRGGRCTQREMEACAPPHTWPRASLPSALPEPRPVLQTGFCELSQQIIGPEEKWDPLTLQPIGQRMGGPDLGLASDVNTDLWGTSQC